MAEIKELREMFEEVQEILIEGYRKRGIESLALLMEQFDVDLMVSLAEPFIAELEKVSNSKG